MHLQPENSSFHIEAQRLLEQLYERFTVAVAEHQAARVLAMSRADGSSFFPELVKQISAYGVGDISGEYGLLSQNFINYAPGSNFHHLHGLSTFMAAGGIYHQDRTKIKPFTQDEWQTVSDSFVTYERVLRDRLRAVPLMTEKFKSWAEAIASALDQVELKKPKNDHSDDEEQGSEPLFTDDEYEFLVGWIQNFLDQPADTIIPFFKHLNLSGGEPVPLTELVSLRVWESKVENLVKYGVKQTPKRRSLIRRVFQGNETAVSAETRVAHKFARMTKQSLFDALSQVQIDVSLDIKPVTIGEEVDHQVEYANLEGILFTCRAIDMMRNRVQGYLTELNLKPSDPRLDNAVVVHEAVAFLTFYESRTEAWLRQLQPHGASVVKAATELAEQWRTQLKASLDSLIAQPNEKFAEHLETGRMIWTLPNNVRNLMRNYPESNRAIHSEYANQLESLVQTLRQNLERFAEKQAVPSSQMERALLQLFSERRELLTMTPEQLFETLLATLSLSDDGELDPDLLAQLENLRKNSGAAMSDLWPDEKAKREE